MKSRLVKGKVIEKVIQTRFFDERAGKMDVTVEGLRFTDGTALYFNVYELEDGYGITGIYNPNGKFR